jgi:hypothetical protein
MNKIVLLAVCCLLLNSVQAFTPAKLHSFSLNSDTVKAHKHSPHKASVYSAVLPGLGQAYNRKYWKIPVVYAALGTSVYFLDMNRTEMRTRQDALTLLLDGDPSTNPSNDLATTPIDVLKAERSYYRTNRDYSIIACAAFYIINIVDATVDAHFYKFNIDQPLALQKQRHWYMATSKVGFVPTYGLAYRF